MRAVAYVGWDRWRMGDVLNVDLFDFPEGANQMCFLLYMYEYVDYITYVVAWL